MRFLLFWSFLTVFNSVFSQDSLKQAVIFFPVKNVVIYLDGHKIPSSQIPIPVEKGMHGIKVWAPTYNLLEDSFMVKKNKVFYSKRLHHSGAYKAFVAKRWLRSSTVVIPPALTFLYSLWNDSELDYASSTMDKASDRRAQAKSILNGFAGSANTLPYVYNYSYANSQYEIAEREYERIKRKGIIIKYTLAGVSLAYFVFTCVHKLKFKEKTLLSRVTPMVDPVNNQFCIQLRLR